MLYYELYINRVKNNTLTKVFKPLGEIKNYKIQKYVCSVSVFILYTTRPTLRILACRISKLKNLRFKEILRKKKPK